MQLLLDNIVATVVAGVVSLLLIALSVDRAEGTRDVVRLQVQTGDEAPPVGSYLFEADGELLLTVQT